MKKSVQRFYAILLLLITTAVIVCSCKKSPKSESKSPVGPKELYEQYLELSLEDVKKAQDTYVYFNNERLQARAQESEWTLQSYEINQWEQLNEDLYVAITTVQNNSHPEPYQIANFVGKIDGEFRVILGILNLPESLKADLDYSKYLEMDEDYLGEVRFDDPSQLPAHERFYRTYLETAMEDRDDSMVYRYFINPQSEVLAKENPFELYRYSIEKWEQLTDELWVVYVDLSAYPPTEPKKIYNFVMYTPGTYKVVAGISNLPEDLKQQINTAPFYDFYGDDVLWAE